MRQAKKLTACILALALGLWALPGPGSGFTPPSNLTSKPASARGDISVYIDGALLPLEDPPFIQSGRTLVPMRAFFEALGAEVQWNEATRTATGTRGGIEVSIPVDSNRPSINGQVVTTDAPARIVNGRIFIPLRFTGEALGDHIEWDGTTRTITIQRVRKPEPPLAADPVSVDGLFLARDSWEDWGHLHNLAPSSEHPGGLELARAENEGERQGVFTTRVLETERAFSRLVPSWNVITPGNTRVVVEVRTRIADEVWTDWQLLGIWGRHISSESRSVNNSNDEYPFRINVDIFQVLHQAGARQYQMRATLRSPNGSDTPVLRTLAATTYGLHPEPGPPPPAGWESELPVPRRSQMVEDAAIRGRICSPVSLAMVLEYLGHREPSASVAARCYDHGARIYGNWSFNVAYAGSLGYLAYVDHFDDLDGVKNHIARGTPVIASIRFGPGELQNSPINSTAGHLVVITGFKIDDQGQEWVIVNDPAARDNSAVRREYLAREFRQAWVGVAYIVEKP